MNDPYTTLGVSRGSTDAEIKSAYRKLAMQHHPDKGGDSKRFADINNAYDNIKDANSRQNFDNGPSNFQQSHSPFTHHFGANFEDVFNQMFKQQVRHTEVQFHVDIEDIYQQKNKHLNISQPNGQSKAITIGIPKGITHGDQVRYGGMGPNGGDLLVTFLIKKHPEYVVEQHNVHKRLPITLREAMCGTEKVVRTLDNKDIKLHIKSGTQSGTKLRIPENGLPRRNLPNGDMIIEVKINIPKLSIDDLNRPLKDVL